jgi:hypothetical protein
MNGHMSVATSAYPIYINRWGVSSPPAISNSYTKIISTLLTTEHTLALLAVTWLNMLSATTNIGPTQAAEDLPPATTSLIKLNPSIMIKLLSVATVI